MRKFANLSTFENIANHIQYDSTFPVNNGGNGLGEESDDKSRGGEDKPRQRPVIWGDDDENADTWAGALKRMKMGKPTIKDMYKWWR